MLKKINFDFLVKGFVCYGLGSIGAVIILIICHNNRLLKFHAGQSLIFYLLLYFVQLSDKLFIAFMSFNIPFLNIILFIFRIIIIITGAYNVYKSRFYKYPVLGEISLKYFA